MKRIQLVIALALCVIACSPKVDNSGYMKEADIKSQIAPGQTKDQVREKLGSPSSVSTFGSETWYYITSRKETTAFFKPEIVEQDVIGIEFDAAGMVTGVASYDKSNSQNVAFVKRTTPTEGHQMGFMEQILGNIGRFNKPGGSTGGFGSRGNRGGY